MSSSGRPKPSPRSPEPPRPDMDESGELPEGWEMVASRSRAGEFAYKNIYTNERQVVRPLKPAKKTKATPRSDEGKSGESSEPDHIASLDHAKSFSTDSASIDVDSAVKIRNRKTSSSSVDSRYVAEDKDTSTGFATPSRLAGRADRLSGMSDGKYDEPGRAAPPHTPASRSSVTTPSSGRPATVGGGDTGEERASYRSKRPSFPMVSPPSPAGPTPLLKPSPSDAEVGSGVSEKRASYRDKRPSLTPVKSAEPAKAAGGEGGSARYKSKRPELDVLGVVGSTKRTDDLLLSPTSVDEREELRDSFGGDSPILDFAKINNEAQLLQSYNFSAEGTFNYKDFEIRPEGISGTPEKSSSIPINLAKDLVRLKLLGRGNGGSVYKALHLPTFKLMALKNVSVVVEETRHQLARELVVLQANAAEIKLNGKGEQVISPPPCPNLLGFYDAFTEGEKSVLMAVEFMDGKSLDDHIKEHHRFTELELGSITYQCLRGLDFLNRIRKMHRDIKPANILLNTMGHAKVSDFGTAREVDLKASIAGRKKEDAEEAEGAMIMTFVGTAMYMAPERIVGDEYGTEADIWSLGLSIFTAAVGKFPFSTEGGWFGLSRSVVKGPPPCLPRGGEFSDGFVDLLADMLEKDKKKRPNAKDLLKYPWVKDCIKRCEHHPPIPEFLKPDVSVISKSFDLSSPVGPGEEKEGPMDLSKKRHKGEGKGEDSEYEGRLLGRSSSRSLRDLEDDPKVKERDRKRIEELYTIADAVTEYYVAIEKAKTGKVPKAIKPLFESKIARLASDLKLPTIVVSVAFDEAFNKFLKKGKKGVPDSV